MLVSTQADPQIVWDPGQTHAKLPPTSRNVAPVTRQAHVPLTHAYPGMPPGNPKVQSMPQPPQLGLSLKLVHILV